MATSVDPRDLQVRQHQGFVNMGEEASLRAAIYTRVSTDDQAETGTSLDDQVRRGAAFCASQGWTVAAVYREEGVSGARESRPQLDALMRSARRQEVDVIVVAKLDRWGRSMRHLTAALGELDELGVRFTSVAEAIDSTSISGRLLRNILGSIAEFERETIIDRTSSGLRSVAREGWWPGGPPPYGYTVEKVGARSRLVVNEREASVIRFAYDGLVRRQLSTWRVADELNALGDMPRRAARWTHGNLRRLLLDAKGLSGTWPYIRGGRAGRTAEQEISVSIPAILSESEFDQLRTALAKTSTGARAARNKWSYLLSGRLVSQCGSPMYGVLRKDRGSRVYRCRDDFPESQPRCNCQRCHADSVEALVWQEVLAMLLDPVRLSAIAEAGVRQPEAASHSAEASVLALDRKINRVESGLGSTLADLVRQGMDARSIQLATKQLESELDELRHKRESVLRWQSLNADRNNRIAKVVSLSARAEEALVDATPDVKRRVLDLLDVRVRVTGWQRCEACLGRGFVASGHAPGSRGRGATGVACNACHRHRAIPLVAIDGIIPDVPGFDALQHDSDVVLPFRLQGVRATS